MKYRHKQRFVFSQKQQRQLPICSQGRSKKCSSWWSQSTPGSFRAFHPINKRQHPQACAVLPAPLRSTENVLSVLCTTCNKLWPASNLVRRGWAGRGGGERERKQSVNNPFVTAHIQLVYELWRSAVNSPLSENDGTRFCVRSCELISHFLVDSKTKRTATTGLKLPSPQRNYEKTLKEKKDQKDTTKNSS